MSSVLNRKRKTGGLHIAIRIGDYFDIEHSGQKLRVTFQGKNGCDVYAFSIVGPADFRVTRSNYGTGWSGTNENKCE